MLDGIEFNANKYVHPITSGYKHIPSGGKNGQILKWSADGSATWGKYEVIQTLSSLGISASADELNKLDELYSNIIRTKLYRPALVQTYKHN